MGILKANEWAPGDGRHVVFANDQNRESAGRVDLRTGRVFIDRPELANDVATALIQWVAHNPEACDFATKQTRQHLNMAPPPDDSPWTDLASNRPGSHALTKIAHERERIRKRSRGYATIDRLLGTQGAAGRWIQGVEGERRIGRVLERMAKRDAWRVIHSIPLKGGGDIDHLLIGRDGVVVVNSKCHPKAKMTVTPVNIYVRGNPTDHIAQARRQANVVSRALSDKLGWEVTAIPCVALFNGGLHRAPLEYHGTPDDVIVGTNWNLPRQLWDAEQDLSDDQVDAIYEVARRSTTWQ